MQTDDDEALDVARKIASPYGLHVEYLSDDPDVRTVGVQGDFRTYSRPVVITGLFPGWDVLEKISSEISSRTPINRVTFETASKEE